MKPIRFAIAQFNPAVGDYAGNSRRMIQWIKRAAQKRAGLIVFPELSLCGYPVWDLANKRSFIEEGMEALQKVAKASASLDISVVLGFIDHPHAPLGRWSAVRPREPYPSPSKSKSYNALAWIENGRIKHIQHKRLLPTYDVFLEDIFFEPGKSGSLIKWKGINIAPTICEDVWDDQYESKPLNDPGFKGMDFVLNISASPFYRGVCGVRENLLKRHAAHYEVPFLYVNQVGAQDDLIFDGRSFFVSETGKMLFKAPAFKEDIYYVDWDRKASAASPAYEECGENDTSEIYEALRLGIRDYFRKNGFHKAVIGLSGGIDSALTAALAVDALGASAVCGITMPGTYSSKGSWADSEELARRLGIEFRIYPIKKKYESILKAYQEQSSKSGIKTPPGKITLAMENLQARLRGLELMYVSNNEGRIVLTTGNKSELAVGYCTLYGDMAGGLAVLGDVYKTDVYRLSRYRNKDREVIPKPILDKEPSAELRPNQTDQDSLPPYEILDEILYYYIEKNEGLADIVKKMRSKKVRPSTVAEVIKKVDHNEYKRRQTPPILRVTEKAWFGRRMPITNRFNH